MKQADARGYQTREYLWYHTDSSDAVGLLCLQAAKSGGLSSIASSITVFNETLRRRPDLAPLWFRPWHHDRRDEQPPGESPYFYAPLAAWCDGMLTIRYGRGFMDSCQRFDDVPPRTQDEIQFLDLIDKVVEEPGVALHIEFRPGDIQFLSNYSILHSRTSYEDYPDPAKRRHLLRLWIALDGARELSDDFGIGGIAGRYGVVALPELADPSAGTRF